MTDKEKLGNLGEEIAVRFIVKQSYKILERNFKKLPWGEIDIIAQKDNYLYFFEVKTTTDLFQQYSAENKINAHKKRALYRIIQIYLKQKRLPLDCFWQLDGIIIQIDQARKKYRLKHIENIFY